MEVRPATIHVLRPLPEETIDTTNKCIRWVLNCTVFYDEAEIDPDELVEGMIGQEMTFAIPPSEEAHTYTMDDLVFTAPHRARLHLSRDLTVA